jgi:hypothetical protein
MSIPRASTTSPPVHAVQPQSHDRSDDAPLPRFLPVERGPQRLAGGFVVGHDDVTWKPAVDLERVILTGLGLGAAVAALGLAVRGRGATGPVRTVTMGPGGWVSFRGTDAPRVVGLRGKGRPSAHRPWWAVLLRARPLG